MRKNNKNKKSKIDKKNKHISVSNKNNINIKISTTPKKKNQISKIGKYKYSTVRPNSLPQYPTYTQYNPSPPIILGPEPDYTKFARHYIKEEPKAVRERLLLEDAPKETKTLLLKDDTAKKERTKLLKDAKPMREKKIYTPVKDLLIKSKKRREPFVDINSFESLMKVRSIKGLKEIFESAGVPKKYINLLKTKNKEEFIKEFLERKKTETTEPEPKSVSKLQTPRPTSEFDLDSDDDDIPFSVHIDSDDDTPINVQSLRRFRSQQALTGGGASAAQDQTSLSGDFYSAPFSPKQLQPQGTPQSIIRGFMKSSSPTENPISEVLKSHDEPVAGGGFSMEDQTATTTPIIEPVIEPAIEPVIEPVKSSVRKTSTKSKVSFSPLTEEPKKSSRGRPRKG